MHVEKIISEYIRHDNFEFRKINSFHFSSRNSVELMSSGWNKSRAKIHAKARLINALRRATKLFNNSLRRSLLQAYICVNICICLPTRRVRTHCGTPVQRWYTAIAALITARTIGIVRPIGNLRPRASASRVPRQSCVRLEYYAQIS